jgi:hypothetical protein
MIALPFKRSTPPDIAPAVEQHIARTHPETHPDAFRWDIAEWVQNREAYQRAASDDGIHVNGLEAIAKSVAPSIGRVSVTDTRRPDTTLSSCLYSPNFPQMCVYSLIDASIPIDPPPPKGRHPLPLLQRLPSGSLCLSRRSIPLASQHTL